MKAKLLGLLLVFAALLPLSGMAASTNVWGTTNAGGEDAPRDQNALRKLCRGFANVLFAIVEIPNQMTKVTSAHGGGAGVTYGLGKGLLRWIEREGVGVYDIVTFPAPVPKGYQPVMKPEFPAEDYEP